MYRSDQYTFEELGTGVWAAIARPGAGASSNSGVADTGRSALVFDTSLTPRAAGDLRVAARILSGKEPLEVVNSHWHPEHTLGNRVFGGATIRSSVRTRELLDRHGADLAARVNHPSWNRVLASLEAQRDAATRPLEREELEARAAACRDLADGRDALTLRAPDVEYSERYLYEGREDLMLTEGAGHSESDTVLWVPASEVMFTGDLVLVDTHPNLGAADVDRWIATLDRLQKVRPRRIVPGHGPVAGPEACATMAGYLRTVRELAQGTSGAVEVPAAYATWSRPGLFAQNLQLLRGARRP